MKTVKNYMFGGEWVSGTAAILFSTSATADSFLANQHNAFLWENSAWDPLPSVYLEFVAKVASGTGYVSLWNITDNAQVLGSESAAIINTAYQRFRVGPFTMPANDLKEFRPKGRNTAGNLLYLTECRLVFVQNGVIFKTVTYIPIDRANAQAAASWWIIDSPKILWEPAKYSNVGGVYFEAAAKLSGTGAAVRLSDGTNPVAGSTFSPTDGINYVRFRSSALTLTDGATYSTELYFSYVAKADLIVKQSGAGAISATQTFIPFINDRRWRTSVDATYAEPAEPSIILYNPAEWDGINAGYFEALAYLSNVSYPGGIKLRNRSDSLDITGGTLSVTSTSKTRLRSGELSSNLPTLSKDLGVMMQVNSGGILNYDTIFLIINQQPVLEALEDLKTFVGNVVYATAREDLKASIKTVGQPTEDLKLALAVQFTPGLQDLKAEIKTSTQIWASADLLASLKAVGLVLEDLKIENKTVGLSLTDFQINIKTKDPTGPIVKGAPALKDSASAAPSTTIAFRLEDPGSGIALSTVKVVVDEYYEDAGGALVLVASNTYKNGDAGFSYTGDSKAYNIVIAPPANFGYNRVVKVKIYGGRDLYGNPGTGFSA